MLMLMPCGAWSSADNTTASNPGMHHQPHPTHPRLVEATSR